MTFMFLACVIEKLLPDELQNACIKHAFNSFKFHRFDAYGMRVVPYIGLVGTEISLSSDGTHLWTISHIGL